MNKHKFFNVYGNDKYRLIPMGVIDNFTKFSIDDDPHNHINHSNQIYELSQEDVKEDMAVLNQLLEYAYAGYEYFLDKEKLNDLLHKIQNKTFSDSLEFAKHIIKTLHQKINDGHFQIYSPLGYKNLSKPYQAYFTDLILEKHDNSYKIVNGNESSIGKILATDFVEDYLFETLPKKDGIRRFYLGVYTNKSIRTIKVSDLILDVHLCKTDQVKEKLEVSIREHNGFVVFDDPKYWSNDIEHAIRLYEKHGLELFKKELFIWNLLNNSGGTDQCVNQFLKTLNGQFKTDILQADIKYLKNKDRDFLKYEVKSEKLKNKRLYKGKTIVLINKHVSSSGEVAALGSKYLKNSLRIGSGTSGCFGFGNIDGYYLPNSKIVLMLPKSAFYHSRVQEGKGLLPDYWLDSANPIDDIAKWLNE